MAILQILHYPDERLHRIARAVPQITAEITELARDMAETMYAAVGIGLAATQVNVHQRVVVIDISEAHNDLLVLINPEITASSGISSFQEGCLSVPGIFDTVSRAEQITVQATGLDGKALRWKQLACWRSASSTKWIIYWARFLSNTYLHSNNRVFCVS